MGDPGVCTSSSIGNGSLGGLVRWYDMSWISGMEEFSSDERCDCDLVDVDSTIFGHVEEIGTGLLGVSS